MPVLPEVGSKMVAPGASSPSFSACSIMKNAARSLTEPVGLRSSSFAHSRTSVLGDSRGSPTSGVLPTESSSESYRIRPALSSPARAGVAAPPAASAPPAGHRRQHRDRVPVLHRRLQPAVPGVKVAKELGEGGAGTLDRLGATGVGAQDGRDTDLDGHERRSWVWHRRPRQAVAASLLIQPVARGDHSGPGPPGPPGPATSAATRTSSSVTTPSTIVNERNSATSGSRVETST